MSDEISNEEFSVFLQAYNKIDEIVKARWERYYAVVWRRVRWENDWELDCWSVEKNGDIHVDLYSSQSDYHYAGLLIENRFLYSEKDWEFELKRMLEIRGKQIESR